MTGPSKSQDPSNFEAQWQARFDRVAARGGSNATISGWSEHGLARRLQAMDRALAQWPLAAGTRVADLGCGTGIYALLLRDRGLKPVAADFSLGMLRRAQEVTSGAALEGGDPSEPRIHLVAASLNELPFADDSFGGLISVGVLQHLSELGRASGEMSRVLKKDGKAFLVTLNGISGHALVSTLTSWPRAWLRGNLVPKKKHAVRRSAAQMIGIYAAAGMSCCGVRGLYLFPKDLRFLELFLEKLEWLKNPITGRPLFLPFANVFLFCLSRD